MWVPVVMSASKWQQYSDVPLVALMDDQLKPCREVSYSS